MEPVKEKDKDPVVLTPTQWCSWDLFSKNAVNIFPKENEEIELVQSDVDDIFPLDYICGSNTTCEIIGGLFSSRVAIDCEDCGIKKTGSCSIHPLTLVLDNPVCRNGSIKKRPKYSLPRVFSLRESRHDPGRPGIWTEHTLQKSLLFGPYEAVPNAGAKLFYQNNVDETITFKQLINTMLDISDLSFCNWMPLVAETALKEEANLIPILLKGCIFFTSFCPIPKKSELIVWTGKSVEFLPLAEEKSETEKNLETLSNALHDHLQLEEKNNEEYHKCDDCGKYLSKKTNMNQHKITHSSIKRHECRWCRRKFTLRSTLIKHIRIHTRNKPYQCSICEKSFSQRTNLKRHEWTHMDERPFKCTICSNSYINQYYLNRHITIHGTG